jgi:hypothetical protein
MDEATSRTSDAALRVSGIGLLVAIVVIHLADIADKFEEVPYLGVGYVGLIAGCVVAAVLLAQPDPTWRDRGWMIGGGVAALTLVGFVLTRTVGLPAATEDLGNWSEPLGIWSLVTEGLMVLLAAVALAPAWRPHRVTT